MSWTLNGTCLRAAAVLVFPCFRGLGRRAAKGVRGEGYETPRGAALRVVGISVTGSVGKGGVRVLAFSCLDLCKAFPPLCAARSSSLAVSRRVRRVVVPTANPAFPWTALYHGDSRCWPRNDMPLDEKFPASKRRMLWHGGWGPVRRAFWDGGMWSFSEGPAEQMLKLEVIYSVETKFSFGNPRDARGMRSLRTTRSSFL